MHMEETTFDILLRKAAQQTTRRETLGALVGGALLLNSRGEIEATKEAERRKKRKRAGSLWWRSTHVRVNNPGRQMIMSKGSNDPFRCCIYDRDGVIKANDWMRLYGLTTAPAWGWFDRKYWFSFENQAIGKPYVEIAINGRNRSRSNCCKAIPHGQTVEKAGLFSENESRVYDINGKSFRVTRLPDTKKYIEWQLDFPADI